MTDEIRTRIESELEVKTYLQNLKFALNNGAKINFQVKRYVDTNRDERYTNQYTVNMLFPDENPLDALRRELLKLSVEDYMRTVKDIRFPKRSEKREFGKIYNDTECQTAHCGRGKSHFIFGGLASPIVPYWNLTQTTDGITADCRSLV